MDFARVLRWLFFGFVALAFLKGGYHLLAQAWFFLEGAHAGDAMYYWAMGRGYLNGLALYSDLFDTKPPAIYLLSALSYRLFDDGTLGFWLNALMVIALPGVFVWGSHRAFPMVIDRTDRGLLLAFAALFGVLMTLFIATQAEAWQVEWYGSFFGVLFVFVLAANGDRMSWKAMAVLTALAFFSIGFKEPYVLALLSPTLLLVPDVRSFLRGYLIPVVIVAVLGVLALVLFGFADGYFGNYLPSHFGHHILRATPLWQRGLQIERLVFSLLSFSYPFAFLIAGLLAFALMRFRLQPFFSVLLLVGAGVLRFVGRGPLSGFIPSYYALLWAVVIVAMAAFLLKKYCVDWRQVALHTIFVLGALYLAVMAGNMRGYYVGNHFVACAPFYAALFIIFIRAATTQWRTRLRKLFAVALVLTAFTVLALPQKYGHVAYASKIEDLRANDATSRAAAEAIDAILDACGVSRYFFIEQKPYLPYTLHSPLNFFVYTGPEAVVYQHPLIIERQLDSLSAAQIIVAEGAAYELQKREEERVLSESLMKFLIGKFTSVPWECARTLPQPPGFTVLYRRDPADASPFPFRMKYEE